MEGVVWELMERGFALCTAIHFLSWLPQIVPLFGSKGLEPVRNFLAEAAKKFPLEDYDEPSWLYARLNKWTKYPTVFWLSSSDKALQLICIIGTLCGTLLFLFPSAYMLWWPSLVCSLSLAVVTGSFSLQTESKMVEINFLTAIAAPFAHAITPSPYASLVPWLLFQWFIFRLMLAAGFVKWYGSEKWRKLTAMDVHYWTQPIPNPVAYYMHTYVPPFFHKLSTIASLLIEIPLPFLGLLLPWWPIRLFTFVSYVGLMAMINITGNYGHLGFMTSIMSMILLEDWMIPSWLHSTLHSILPTAQQPAFLFFSLPSSGGYLLSVMMTVVLLGLGLLHFVCTLPPLFCTCRAQNRLPRALNTFYRDMVQPFHLANTYGMFGAMQDYRWEVMIEGSHDGENWKRYPFQWKMWDPARRPPVVFPLGYWPRLDWHMWLLGVKSKMQWDTVMAIGDSAWLQPPSWYKNLLQRLMEGDKKLLSLMGENPFPRKPPTYLRGVVVDCVFAPPGSKQWWTTKEIVVPPNYCLGPEGWSPPVLKLPKAQEQKDEPFRKFSMTMYQS